MATHKEIIRALCLACVERAEALGYKGKRRDDFSLDYFASAAKTAELTGATILSAHIARIGVMLIATRGYVEVVRISQEDE
jgi:hypothetical protein